MSAAWILHPNVPSTLTGLEGFRKAAFPIAAYVLMRAAWVTDARPLVRVFIVGSLPAFLFGIRQYFVPLPIDQAIVGSSGVSWETFMQASQLRAFSPTSGPFHLGMLAAAAVIAGMVMTRASDRRWVVPTAVAAATLALTLTRAIWIGTLVGSVAAAAALLASERRSSLKQRDLLSAWRIAAKAGVAILGLLVVVAAFGIATQQADRWTAFIQSSVIDPKNLWLRFEYWSSFVAPIQQSPWTGYGTSAAEDGSGSVYLAAGMLRLHLHSILSSRSSSWASVGLCCSWSGFSHILQCAVRSVTPAPISGSIAIGVLTLTLVAGITGPMLDAYPFNLLFWALAGIVVNIAAREGSPAGRFCNPGTHPAGRAEPG